MRAPILALALAASNAHAVCAWSDPGANRFTGNHAQAILSEPSLPLWVRPILFGLRAFPPTDRLDIWPDAVTGRDPLYRYSEVVRGMRFGKDQRCDTISRPWPAFHSQSADGWCAFGHCYAVPDACGNPSFIRRYERPAVALAGAAQAVPEPSALVLVLSALAVLAALRRR